jgi:nucleoside-diphosphate-sugar epimerase
MRLRRKAKVPAMLETPRTHLSRAEHTRGAFAQGRAAARRCLVTGATGFTGGHLARRLARQGHEVVALVRPGSDTQALERAGIELFSGQLTRKPDVIAAAAGAERIFHIAGAFRTAAHPDSYYRDVNVGGTLNVLEAARRGGCERVVHCSTVGVHGHIEKPPADESYRTRPGDIYQETKLEGELAAQYAMRRGQPVSIVRPGPIYGEGDLRLLKLFRPIRKRRFVMIGQGEVRFQLVHVDDLVNGILLCSTLREAVGEVFIITGAEAPTLNQLVATIATAVGVPAPRLRVPIAPVYALGGLCEAICVPLGIEPPLYRRRVAFFSHHREFDISKARQVLGYEPRVSLQEGVRRTALWYSGLGLIDPVGEPAEMMHTSQDR